MKFGSVRRNGNHEQNITVSAGMAYIGKESIYHWPSKLYSMRSAEQVKVDVAYSHNNVTVIGISGESATRCMVQLTIHFRTFHLCVRFQDPAVMIQV